MSRKNRSCQPGMGTMAGRGSGACRKTPVYGRGSGTCRGIEAPTSRRGLGRGRRLGQGLKSGAETNYNYEQTTVKKALPKNKATGKIYIDDSCVGCGLCVETCPAGAISLVENKAVVDNQICTKCGSCIRLCPAGAIHQEN